MLWQLGENQKARLESAKSKVSTKYYDLKTLFWIPDLSSTTLVFDTSTICTADCIFCAYQYDTRPKRLASFSLFQMVIDQYISLGGTKLNLTPLTGEIFTNKHALKMLSYAKDAGIKYVSFFTNCSLLHTIDLHELLRLNVDKISLSVSPLSEELYKSTYRSNQYKRVLQNIKELLETLQSSDSKTTISICFRGQLDLNQCTDLPDFHRHVKPYLGPNTTLSAMTEFDTWNGKIAESDLLEGMTISTRKPPAAPLSPCSRLRSIYVDPSGTVRLCGCRTNYSDNISDSLELGSIYESTLLDLYTSSQASGIRNSFLLGNINKLCAGCTWYNL